MSRWFMWISVIALVGVSCISGMLLGWFINGALASSPLTKSIQIPQQQVATPLPTPTSLAIRQSANDLEQQVIDVYKHAGPGVVNITNRSFEMDFFLQTVPREGTGSGFFYDTQGHIVTNYHVIEHASELQVTLADGHTMPAKIVGSDPSNDLAVIKVDMSPNDVPVVPVGDSLNVQVGQFVVAIGSPFGLEHTLTMGVISSLGRIIESPNQRFIGEVIQTDAPVNPGNSGGPLLDLAGNVIGVNSAIFSPSGASAGIGFAISARTVQRVVPALITSGRYPHPSLGAQLYELKPETINLLQRAGMHVPVNAGLLVIKTLRNQESPLQGGTRQVRVGNLIVPIGGDIIVAINQQTIVTYRDLIVYLETQTQVGQTVQVTIIRDGKEQIVPVVLLELAM